MAVGEHGFICPGWANCPLDDRYWDWGGRKTPLTQAEIDHMQDMVRGLGAAAARQRCEIALEVYRESDIIRA